MAPAARPGRPPHSQQAQWTSPQPQRQRGLPEHRGDLGAARWQTRRDVSAGTQHRSPAPAEPCRARRPSRAQPA
eukprot:15457133-Alexandrium_andersonii.AAC.1